MAGNLDVAISGNKAFLVLVEDDGYTVEEYPSKVFGVKDFEGCFSFSLENQLYFCVQKTLYQFIKDQRKWKQLIYNMEIVRYGTACVSLDKGTIIAGGAESDGSKTPTIKGTCVLIRNKEQNLITSTIGTLPTNVKYHTLTKVSSNSFIMCGGMDVNGYETREVYLGTLNNSTSHTSEVISEPSISDFYLTWIKLPRMRRFRSGHFSMFVNNLLYVFGGGLKRPEEEHVMELNALQCGLEIGLYSGMVVEVLPFKLVGRDQFLAKKWKKRYMMYDISFANLVLSPDQKYAVIAGGEIYGLNLGKDDQCRLTMNTKDLFMRSIQDMDNPLYTNNVLKMIMSCDFLTPMYDDISAELQKPQKLRIIKTCDLKSAI